MLEFPILKILFLFNQNRGNKIEGRFLIIYNPMVIERLEDTRNQGLLSFQSFTEKMERIMKTVICLNSPK